ncbi:MAG: hypothetical protein GY710_06150 [Desulfobacteraceae bacterium]|nr:hypothetical protein [Desulfobacteraceae bacterium]
MPKDVIESVIQLSTGEEDSLDDSLVGDILGADVSGLTEDLGTAVIGEDAYSDIADTYEAVADPLSGVAEGVEGLGAGAFDALVGSPLSPSIDAVQGAIEDPLGLLVTEEGNIDPGGVLESGQNILSNISGIEDAEDKTIDPFGLIEGITDILPTTDEIETFTDIATDVSGPLITGDIEGATDVAMDVTGFDDVTDAIGQVNEDSTDQDLADIAEEMGYNIDRLRELRARMQGLKARQAGLLYEEGETATGRTLLG